MSKDPWKTHGYFFSACLGAFVVLFGWGLASLLDIPAGVPLNQALTNHEQLSFVLPLGVVAALAYLAARVTSAVARALIDVLKRREDQERWRPARSRTSEINLSIQQLVAAPYGRLHNSEPVITRRLGSCARWS